MPKVLDFEYVKSILRFRFMGYSSKKTGEEMKCSPRTVRNKVRDFIKATEEAGPLEEGLMKAASEYGIRDLVSGLLDISKNCRDNELEVPDAVKGLNVHARLVKAGMSDLEQLLIEVEKQAGANEYPREDLASLMVESMRLKNATGKSYMELTEQAETLPRRVEELVQEEAELQAEVNKLQREQLQKLREAETTDEKLEEYFTDKEALGKVVDFSDTHRVTNLVLNFRDADYDVEEIIGFYSSAPGLKERRVRIEAKVKELENTVKNLESEKDRLQKEKLELKGEIDVGKQLKENELEPVQAREIMDMILKVSAKYAIDHHKAYEKLMSVLENAYDPILRLENQLSILTRRLKNLMDEIELEQVKLETLIKEYEVKQSRLEELDKLNETGLKFNDLRNWNLIIQKAGLDPGELLDSMEEWEGILGAIEEYRIEQTGLRADITQLEAEIATLEDNRTRIKAEIKEYHNQIRGILQELLGEFEGKLQEALELSTLSYEIGRNARTHIDIRAIMNMIEEKPIDFYEALHNMRQIISAMERWAENNRQYQILQPLQNARAQIVARLAQ